MGCEICGRNNCTKSFHSLDEQDEFDKITDSVKERMREGLLYSVRRIKDVHEINGSDYIPYDEVVDIIDNY